MGRTVGCVLLVAVAMSLGVEAKYVTGYQMYAWWFLALVLASGITGMITRQVRLRMLTGLFVWLLALGVYEVTAYLFVTGFPSGTR